MIVLELDCFSGWSCLNPFFVLVILLLNKSKKSNPHFLNGFSGKLVTSLVKLCFNKLLVLWHWSQVQQYSWTSQFIINHQYSTSKIFFIMILEDKCCFATPPCNSYKIVGTCSGYRTQQTCYRVQIYIIFFLETQMV